MMPERLERERKHWTQEIPFGRSEGRGVGYISPHYPFPARLSVNHVARLKALNVARVYAKGKVLFREGDRPAGVYVVLSGGAKLSVSSAQGQVLLLGVFGSGSILGLPSAILGRIHATTAETLEQSEIIYVSRKEFRRSLQENPTAARQAAELVSEACYFLVSKMTTIELSKSATQRLARCLVGLLAHNTGPHGSMQGGFQISQETISQMAGLSRETVARILSRFRQQRIVDWKRSGFVVHNKVALEKLADLPECHGNVRV